MNGTTTRWTAEDDRYLKANYLTQQHKQIGRHLGRSSASVRNRAWRLGLQKKVPKHTDATRAIIREFYEAHIGKPMSLGAFARKIGMDRTTISGIARELGLTDPARPDTPEEIARRAAVIRWHWRMNGHPRGMLGKNHNTEARQRMSVTRVERYAALTPTQRAAPILKGLKTKAERGNLINPRPKTTWKQEWHQIGGKRNFYRSHWEANYAHYLQWLKERGEIADWEHEPTTFWFEKIRRGVRSYTPDFLVTEKNGAQVYHEVKGWMDDKSATKIRRMAKYHPDVKLIVVDAATYKALHRQVLGLVPGWC